MKTQQPARFRMKILGDSMADVYRAGDLVEFDSNVGRLKRGEEYFVECQGRGATFKRLSEIHRRHLVFGAINRKMHPTRIVIRREAITRIAKTVFLCLPSGKMLRGRQAHWRAA